MRYYLHLLSEDKAAKLVEAASEEMHGFPMACASSSSVDAAHLILDRLEKAAPDSDMGMSRTITALGLWSPEAKALRRRS